MDASLGYGKNKMHFTVQEQFEPINRSQKDGVRRRWIAYDQLVFNLTAVRNF